MFGMETGKKFVGKGHDKKKMQKRVVQLCTLTKISSECYSRKKMAHTFLKKSNWNFQVCCFTLRNSEQNKAIHP